MFNLFEDFLSTGSRTPAATVERLAEVVMMLFRRRRDRQKRIDLALSVFQRSNHLRRDVGLPPVDSNGRRL
jgi:hypothetical protein